MDLIYHSANVLLSTLKDVAPIIGVILFFQLVVIRKKIDSPGRLVYGFFLVVIGLIIFMIGLEEGLFPLGEAMSRQLTAPLFLSNGDTALLEEIERTGNITITDGKLSVTFTNSNPSARLCWLTISQQ